MSTPVLRGNGLPALALLLNAAVWGLSWWPFRALGNAGLHPLWACAVVYSLSVLLVSVWRPGAWRDVLRSPSMWLLLLAAGATNAAFNWAVTIGDVVRVVLLFYLMPLWAVLLGWLMLGERPPAAAGLRVALAVVGAAVVLWPEGGGWPVPRNLAEGLGLAGGVFFALNNVLLRREASHTGAAKALAMFVGGLVVPSLLAAGLAQQGVIPAFPSPSWAWLPMALGLGLAFLLGNGALQYGATRLRAATTGVIMITEVLFAASSAIALGAGQWTSHVAVGGGLIVAAALLSVFGDQGG